MQLKQADDGADVRKLSAATMIDGKLNSPAQECKRWLDFEGNHGAKSNKKNNKREGKGNSGNALYCKAA